MNGERAGSLIVSLSEFLQAFGFPSFSSRLSENYIFNSPKPKLSIKSKTHSGEDNYNTPIDFLLRAAFSLFSLC